MKATGVLLVILGSLYLALRVVLAPLFGDVGVPSEGAIIVAVLLLVGGLIVWSLQHIREVLLETQEITRSILDIEAADDDPRVP